MKEKQSQYAEESETEVGATANCKISRTYINQLPERRALESVIWPRQVSSQQELEKRLTCAKNYKCILCLALLVVVLIRELLPAPDTAMLLVPLAAGPKPPVGVWVDAEREKERVQWAAERDKQHDEEHT